MASLPTADALISTGLADLGYVYVNIGIFFYHVSTIIFIFILVIISFASPLSLSLPENTLNLQKWLLRFVWKLLLSPEILGDCMFCCVFFFFFCEIIIMAFWFEASVELWDFFLVLQVHSVTGFSWLWWKRKSLISCTLSISMTNCNGKSIWKFNLCLFYSFHKLKRVC